MNEHKVKKITCTFFFVVVTIGNCGPAKTWNCNNKNNKKYLPIDTITFRLLFINNGKC